MINYHILKTKLGYMAIVFNNRDLIQRVFLAETNLIKIKTRIQSEFPAAKQCLKLNSKLSFTINAITNHLNGKKPQYKVSDFDFSIVSDFQKQVLLASFKIPFSKTSTYSDLAIKINNPKASRAVGTALGKNPFPLVFPCHRVLAKSGQLGGFSATGGIETKKQLLNIEQQRAGKQGPFSS